MKKTSKKSGRKRFSRKRITELYHESADRVGKHFLENFASRISNIHEVRLWVIEWFLLVTVVFLFAIVQMMWYGGAYKTEAYVRGGDYIEAVVGDVNSMNPLYATTNAERALSRLLFANIVTPDLTGHMKGELAKSVTHDDSGKVWTVKLKDDIYWSDGEPIVADDLIYTVDLIRDTTAKTTILADFSRVNMKKTDDKTVEFALPSTYMDFVDTLEFPLVPKHILGNVNPALVFENEFSTKPVCSGPFVLNVVQMENVTSLNKSTIHLNRNTKYFGNSTRLDTFTLKTYDSEEDIISALNNSEVTATAELSVSARKDLSNKISYRESTLNGGLFAFFNTKSDVMKNKTLRQAIQMGVDMAKVREELSDSQKLDYPILKRQEDLSYPDLVGYNFDGAKELVTKAGYKYNENGKVVDDSGKIVSVNIAAQKRDVLEGVVLNYVEEVKKLGFEVALNLYEEDQNIGADFFSDIVRPRDYDILFYEVDLGVSADPFVYYSSTQATIGGWNFSNYSNSLVDDALLSAHTTTNMATRKAKYEYFLKAWVADVPAIGIYQSSLRYYYIEDTETFSENAVLTDALDRFTDVEYWATERKTVNVTP